MKNGPDKNDENVYNYNKLVASFRERTVWTERPPLVGEVSANFCD
jgi:hypothetical protein